MLGLGYEQTTHYQIRGTGMATSLGVSCRRGFGYLGIGRVTMSAPSMLAMIVGECDCGDVPLAKHDDFCVVWDSIDREDI